jgi:hypothetical protein
MEAVMMPLPDYLVECFDIRRPFTFDMLRA